MSWDSITNLCQCTVGDVLVLPYDVLEDIKLFQVKVKVIKCDFKVNKKKWN